MNFDFQIDQAADCLICAGSDAFWSVAKGYALAFAKLCAGYGTDLVTALLTMLWIWELGKGLVGEQIDKQRLAETSFYCIIAGMLMTQPDEIFAAFFWLYTASLDLSAKAFQVLGQGGDVSGISGLLASVEKGIVKAFGPTLESIWDEVSLDSLTPLLALIALLLPTIAVARQLFVHVITPMFILFGIACAFYPLTVLSIFPQTRRAVGNALRLAGAASLQTVFASVVLAFALTILATVAAFAGKATITAFGTAFMAMFMSMVFLAIAVGPLMALPYQLFDVIQQGGAGGRLTSVPKLPSFRA